MTEFVTVSKKDPQFWPLLDGSFSKAQFAKPIKTLYLKSENEQVTFKLIAREKGTLSKALKSWFSLSRHIFLVFPVLGIVSTLYATHGTLPWQLVVLSAVSLQFFMMALTLYSDYHDYVNGVDRINEHNFSKPILIGAIRPFQVQKLARLFLGFAIVCGVPLFYLRPATLFIAGSAFLLSFVSLSSAFGQRFKGLTSLICFLFCGPLLALGLEALLIGSVSWGAIVLGFLYGFHAFKYDFTKQMRDLFYNSKAKIKNISTTIGFEKSKVFYSFLSLCHLGILGLLVIQFQNPNLLVLLILAFLFEIYINRLIYGAASFLSSNVSQAMGLQKLHFCVETFMAIFLFLSPLWF